MRRRVPSWLLFSVSLIAIGTGFFLYKVLYLHYPLSIADEPQTWRIEEVINITGRGGRVVVESPLPRSSPYEHLDAEEVRSGLLRFSIYENSGGRRGRWSGKLDGATTVSYQVTVTAYPYRRPLPPTDTTSEYNERVMVFLAGSSSVQVNDPAILDLSRELGLSSADKVPLAREIFSFVSREIGTLRSSGPMDAVSVVREGRGDPLGRARLFCALARANRLPCRIVSGLILTGKSQNELYHWNEVYVGDDWVPFDAVAHLAEALPPNRLALSASDDPEVSYSGTSAVSYRFYVQSETEPYTELVRRRLAASQAVFDRFSLLLLPVHVQRNLRLLLLVPLGALSMAILRNVVGIRTFGMFMPMLIALAMTTTGLALGSAFLGAVVSLALLIRLWIQRFYLLLAPRIAFTLTLVVLLMVGLISLGDRFHIETSGIGVFPFVIMTMIVERITVSLEEEGTRNTVNRILSTLFAIYFTYAVIEARALQMIFLVFPELLIVILGLLVLVGRYTGYRLTELQRFRDILAPARGTESPSPNGYASGGGGPGRTSETDTGGEGKPRR